MSIFTRRRCSEVLKLIRRHRCGFISPNCPSNLIFGVGFWLWSSVEAREACAASFKRSSVIRRDFLSELSACTWGKVWQAGKTFPVGDNGPRCGLLKAESSRSGFLTLFRLGEFNSFPHSTLTRLEVLITRRRGELAAVSLWKWWENKIHDEQNKTPWRLVHLSVYALKSCSFGGWKKNPSPEWEGERWGDGLLELLRFL